jgi:hypothetical protein
MDGALSQIAEPIETSSHGNLHFSYGVRFAKLEVEEYVRKQIPEKWKWGQSSLLTQIAPFGLELGDAAPAANSIREAIYHLMSRGNRREEIFRDSR